MNPFTKLTEETLARSKITPEEIEIAKMYGSKFASEIAEETGLSIPRIQQIVRKAREQKIL